jgi:Domain of unknown function (DUF4432)
MNGPMVDFVRAGKLANLDQLAGAISSTVADGPARGCRALDLRVAGGIDLRILPDRGFDIGQAWFRGVPLAWISGAGESASAGEPTGEAWRETFGGGLVTTCGLRNVGSPSEGHGLHGRFSHLRASDVRVERTVDEGDLVLTARAVIDEVDQGGAHLRVERTVATRTGRGRVELTDVTVNLGGAAEPAPILYHVNVGVPLFDQAAAWRSTASRSSLAMPTPNEDWARGWSRGSPWMERPKWCSSTGCARTSRAGVGLP